MNEENKSPKRTRAAFPAENATHQRTEYQPDDSASPEGQSSDEMKRAQEALADSEAHVESIIETAVSGIVTIDELGKITLFNPAAQRMFGYAKEEALGQDVATLMPEPYRAEHGAYIRRYLETNEPRIIGTGLDVNGRRKDGSVFPVHVSVGESRDARGRFFTGIVENITDRRLLERHVLEIGAQIKQQVGQELHDSVGQELAGLKYLATAFSRELEKKSAPEAEMGREISEIAERIQSRVASAIRGLTPVDVDEQGLMSALELLASGTTKRFGIPCTFECRESVRVNSNQLATQLYRIAQEAITNAVKHGHPDTIEIRLSDENGTLRLEIMDDGEGLREEDIVSSDGLGLKIMRHRCKSVFGHFDVGLREGGGTKVSCAIDLAQYTSQGS